MNAASFQEDYHYKLKISILGDSKAGKSTFLESKKNIFKLKKIKQNSNKINILIILTYKINKKALTQNNGKIIDMESSEELSQRNVLLMNHQLMYNINYFEIPGKDRNIPYVINYAIGSTVCIVLFDYNKTSSFKKAEKIFEMIAPSKTPINILIANKSDTVNKAKGEYVSDIDINNLIYKYKLKFFKTNSNKENDVLPILNEILNDVKNYIGNNMELQNLIGKNVGVGKRIFNHPDFLKNLQDNSYFKN
jgi:signal recognition particle receptor subunit beta